MNVTVKECFGEEFYQPHKILVLVKEALDEGVLDKPITSLLTETVINVSAINGFLVQQ